MQKIESTNSGTIVIAVVVVVLAALGVWAYLNLSGSSAPSQLQGGNVPVAPQTRTGQLQGTVK